MQSSSSVSTGTFVIQDWQQILGKVMKFFMDAKDRMDICAITVAPSQPEPVQGMTDAYLGIRKKGGKLRLLTLMNKENVQYCREAMNMGIEIRHLDGISGNFAVSDGEYLASLQTDEFNPRGPVLYSNETIFVKHHQAIFDMLWSIGIPGDKRATEIEQGINPGKFEVSYFPEKTMEIIDKMVEEAKKEILVMFPSRNSFHRQEERKFMEKLRKAAQSGMRVRVLTAIDDIIEKKIAAEAQSSAIEFQRISPEYGTQPSGMVIVDREKSVTMEIKNDKEEEFPKAIGAALYCTSVSTVLSNVSFFDRLWEDSRLVEEIAKRRNQSTENAVIAPTPWEITPFAYRCVRCGRKVEKEIRIYEPEAMIVESRRVSQAMRDADAGWIPFCYDCISNHPLLKPSWLIPDSI